MVYLNEWLPNPAGPDASGEFVELFNNGQDAVILGGWSLWTGKGKRIPLSGYNIASGGYLILSRPAAKLSLKNTDGGLWLYGPNGDVKDSAAFSGEAPEGQSFGRQIYDGGAARATTSDFQEFAWSDPTPGAKNIIAIDVGISENKYPYDIVLNPPMGIYKVLGCAAFLSILISITFFYAIKKNRYLSEFFRRRDKKSWQGSCGIDFAEKNSSG